LYGILTVLYILTFMNLLKLLRFELLTRDLVMLVVVTLLTSEFVWSEPVNQAETR